jgi:hypothetical protein
MKRVAILFLATLAAAVAMPSTAQAGYSHYFIFTSPPDETRLKACIADMGRIVAAADQLVAGPDGAAAPIVEPLKIEFNGRGENAHEPFVFPGKVGVNNCKTQFKPYDAVVTACLIVAHDYFPPSTLTIASDGQWDDGDWAAGARLYEKALSRRPTDPTYAPDDVQPLPDPQQDSMIGKVILIGLGLVVVWWFAHPRIAFTLFVEGNKLDRVRGDAPRQFLMDVDDICRQFNIRRGTVRALQIRNWNRLVFSSDIPPECRQRIRNTWTAHLWRRRIGRPV